MCLLLPLCRVPRPRPGGGTCAGGSQESAGGGGVAASHGLHPAQTFSWIHKLLSAIHQGVQSVHCTPLRVYFHTIPFVWTPEAEDASGALKRLFLTAPVLIFPDPDRQFIVEVDASDTGIGAVLSQRAEEDQQVHPVAFLSRRFTPAERNYDVGNRELLAVHAALEEWRHWLEGAQHPVLIWTDHKNLTYIREVKRLGPRQAHWALCCLLCPCRPVPFQKVSLWYNCSLHLPWLTNI